MFKKILSTALVLAMALSVVGALQMTSFAADTMDFETYPGNHMFKRADGNPIRITFNDTSLWSTWAGVGNNLFDRAKDRPNSGGFRAASGSAPNGAPGTMRVASSLVGRDYAIRVSYSAAPAYATADELAALSATEYFVNIDGVATPALYLNFDPTAYATSVGGGIVCTGTQNIHYLITVASNRQKTWYPIRVGGEALVAGTYDYDASLIPDGYMNNTYFQAQWGGAPAMYSGGGKGLNIGLNDLTSGFEGWLNPSSNFNNVGTFATAQDGDSSKPKGIASYVLNYGFNFDVPEGYTAPSVTALTLTYNGVRIAELNPNGFSLLGNQLKSIYGTSATRTGAIYVADGADVSGVQADASQLEAINTACPYVKGQMNKLSFIFNYDKEIIKYYYNGLPVYFAANDGKYYDELVFSVPLSKCTISGTNSIVYTMNRGTGAIDHDCYIDDIAFKYTSASLAEVDSKELLIGDLTSKGPNWIEDLNAYQGIAIEADIKGTLNKMKWIFNTSEESIISKTFEFAPPVTLEGPTKFGVVLANGVAEEGNTAKDYDEILNVDAIFDIDGTTYYTNWFYSTKFNK